MDRALCQNRGQDRPTTPDPAVREETMPETPAELQQALMALSLTWLDEGPKLQPDLDRILAVAERSVPGCDAASVTLIVEGRPQTEAVIDRVVVAVDLAQYELQEGPCLAAAAENRPIQVDLVPTDERFPRFAERVAHTGVKSSLSMPVVAVGGPVGSLNLYSWTPSSFDATSQDLGAVLATQVGVAVAKSRLLTNSQDLAVVAQRLADDNADIAVAHGMLMVLEQCTPEQAAALIRNAASSETETLVAIARRIIAEVTTQRRSQPSNPTTVPTPTRHEVHNNGESAEERADSLRVHPLITTLCFVAPSSCRSDLTSGTASSQAGGAKPQPGHWDRF